MSRSNWFLMTNMLIFCVVLTLFFYYNKTAPERLRTGPGNLVSQKEFVKESAVLDSLFKNYKIAAARKDEAALVDSELRLKDQLNEMKDHCNQGSLMNDIACKLVNNYRLRIQLIVASGHLKEQSSDQTNNLKKRIAELEKSNEQIRLQNQMVQQAILNLP